VNPHKRLRHLYGSRMRAQYRGKTLGELSPHVYAIAEQVCMSFIRGTTICKAMHLQVIQPVAVTFRVPAAWGGGLKE